MQLLCVVTKYTITMYNYHLNQRYHLNVYLLCMKLLRIQLLCMITKYNYCVWHYCVHNYYV